MSRARAQAVVEDAIPERVLDHLAYRLDFDAAHQVASEQKYQERGVFGHGHLQLGVPRCAPWVHGEVVANPILEQLAAAVLGPCFLGFYNGNTNTPQSGAAFDNHSQPMHADGDWVWKNEAEAAAAGVPWPPPATGVVMNFGVDDITDLDGTEVWPGKPPAPQRPCPAASQRLFSTRRLALRRPVPGQGHAQGRAARRSGHGPHARRAVSGRGGGPPRHRAADAQHDQEGRGRDQGLPPVASRHAL